MQQVGHLGTWALGGRVGREQGRAACEGMSRGVHVGKGGGYCRIECHVSKGGGYMQDSVSCCCSCCCAELGGTQSFCMTR